MKYFILVASFFVSCIVTIAQPKKSLDQLYADMATKKDTALVNTWLDIALTHRLRNNPDSSKFYYTKCNSLAKDIHYLTGQCSALAGIGDIYMNKQKEDSALMVLLDALSISENLTDRKQLVQTRLKQRIASIYLYKNDAVKALNYLLEAEKLTVELKDSFNLVSLYKDLSYCYGLKKDTVSAINYYKKGIALSDLLEKNYSANETKMFSINRATIFLILNGMGFFNDKKLYTEALGYMEKIWNNPSQAIAKFNASQIRTCMTSLYKFTSNYEKAIEFGNAALKDSTLDQQSRTGIFQDLADSYSKTGDYKKAYENMSLFFKNYYDRFEADKFSALADLETKYQTEKKEQQIASLNKEKKNQRIITGISIAAFIIALGLLLFALRVNRLQKKLFAKEKELQKREMEKRMFELEQTALRAQMNPHFIFNSLNSVQRFVINNDTEGVNRYLSTFANLIRQTLENSGKQLIPLKDELRYLETYLRLEQMRGSDKFKYLILVNPDINTEETYIPNMIIQPYLENSVIHGMTGKKENEGVINLHISKNHKLTCVVEDNGTGIAASRTLKKEMESDHESMGTAITEKRIEMFNTMNSEKIELEVLDKSESGEPESGTKVMIKFPLHITAN